MLALLVILAAVAAFLLLRRQKEAEKFHEIFGFSPPKSKADRLAAQEVVERVVRDKRRRDATGWQLVSEWLKEAEGEMSNLALDLGEARRYVAEMQDRRAAAQRATRSHEAAVGLARRFGFNPK